MLKLCCTVLLVVAAAATLLLSGADAASSKWSELEGYTFEQYVDEFGKPYPRGTPEYRMRKSIFAANLAKMKLHNSQQHSWKQGPTIFSDLSPAEWKQFNRFKKSPHRPAPARTFGVEDAPAGYVIPLEVDWRYRTNPQVVSPVKHQGQCGCCWAVSAAESMEVYHAMLTGKMSTLSFQQINSCVPQPMSYGCDGGDYAMAFKYLETAEPLNEEWCYGFTDFFSLNGGTTQCFNISSKFTNKKPYSWFAYLTQTATIPGNSFVAVTPNNATAAKLALAMIGPQSISVAAGNWQNYQTGIFSNTDANGADNEWAIDHAVQMVGYGYDKDLNKNYWIVKNSWSTQWGRNGYIYLDSPDTQPCSPQEYGPVCGTSGCLSDLMYPLVRRVKPLPF